MNCSYYECKVVNHMKIGQQFFPKENLIRPNYIFPHYILILFIHCILLSKEILLIPTITTKNAKNASQFLKKHFHLRWGKSLITLGIFIVKWILNNNTRTHNHLFHKRTLNYLAKLVKWLSCVVSTYLYGPFDCMFLSCHVHVSEWIHTL